MEGQAATIYPPKAIRASRNLICELPVARITAGTLPGKEVLQNSIERLRGVVDQFT